MFARGETVLVEASVVTDAGGTVVLALKSPAGTEGPPQAVLASSVHAWPEAAPPVAG